MIVKVLIFFIKKFLLPPSLPPFPFLLFIDVTTNLPIIMLGKIKSRFVFPSKFSSMSSIDPKVVPIDRGQYWPHWKKDEI